jgi:hypothetical protein
VVERLIWFISPWLTLQRRRKHGGRPAARRDPAAV